MTQQRPHKSPRVPPQPHRRLLPGVLLVVFIGLVIALVWGVVAFAPDEAERSVESRVAHVHGLGLNPTDGALYVATHYGMFRISEAGMAERVGPSFQDTMGFTVAGPDSFLGSGHPDVAGMQAGQPSLLGLIESSDGGRTWVSRSLAGEVDFHALAYAHGQVYGWDAVSGRFMVSADRQSWGTRSQLQLHGFAVDPANPDRIRAAAPGGVRVSDDGGRTWSPPSGPSLATIAWAADGVLWGLDPGGGVQHSTDGGHEWVATGRLPGEPQALSATGGAVWAAAGAHDEPTGIYRSTDDGRSWKLHYQDAAPLR